MGRPVAVVVPRAGGDPHRHCAPARSRPPSPPIMEVIGLTGGIACGKTAVARSFAARGVPVVDADQVARDVVLPGSEGLAAVVASFAACKR